MTSDYHAAAEKLKALAQAERARRREQLRKCDWEDPEDVSAYRQEVYQARRVALLNKLVPTRVCPTCGAMKLSSREWVVSRDGKVAACRKCRHNSNSKPQGAQIMDVTLFPEVITRFKLSGGALTSARVRASLSTGAFAQRAGWSLSYQRKLESRSDTVNEETARVIIQVLQEHGVTTRDTLS